MRTVFYIFTICFLLLPSYVRGQVSGHGLTSELYEREFPVLRSFKNKRIAEIEALRNKMLLVPANTEKGAELWSGFLGFCRQSLISFPLDASDKEDEEYWNRIMATLMPWFYICCDDLEGREKESYNNILTSKNFLYHAYKYADLKQTTWENVRDMLDDDEVAIELRVMPDEALILKKGQACPVSVPLDSAMLEQLGRYKGVDALETSEMYATGGTLARLWAAIAPAIGDARRIYLSASHFLCNFNYGAIPTKRGTTVDDEYDFHYLVSTEDIKAFKRRTAKNEYRSAAIFGDITYGTGDERTSAAQPRTVDSNQLVWDLTRGMDEGTRGRLLPLQHSGEEIKAIGNILESSNLDVKMYDAARASEETFKRIVTGSKPDIIHLSTHGFMLAVTYSADARAPKYPQSLTASKYATSLLRSGLLLAGASQAWNGNPPTEGVEDGILTTGEIIGMDFRGTKLAVLSACKTGLGNDTNLTGLSIGPQHAFKTRGVETVVMSLWMVDDAATSLLMQYFYQHLLTGQTTKCALRQAQKDIIQQGYDDPYYWAAFVVLE